MIIFSRKQGSAKQVFVIGLGNPGAQYEHTRHNAGYMALNHIAKEYKFPPFKSSSKYQALISKKEIKEITFILAKPETYMNNSGKTVHALLKNSHKEAVVIHDEIDLPLGQIKISKGKGSAGHKGVESIIQEIGTKDFTRIRIGIHPSEGKPANLEEFVLQKFSPQELSLFETSLESVSSQLFDSIIK